MKVPLPIRRVKLSEWVLEIPAPKLEPGPLQVVEMVAECLECHLIVEYSRLESS
jgi:hypothetical protein